MDINSKIKDIFLQTFNLQLTADVRQVIQYVKKIKLNGGDILFNKNDNSDAFYILLTGKLIAYIENGLDEIAYLGEINNGETVGEIGVIINEPRTASVKALRDSVLLRISKDDFNQLKQIAPEITDHITQVTIHRLIDGNLKKKKSIHKKNIVFYSCTPHINLHFYVEKIVNQIQKSKTVFHIANDEKFPTEINDLINKANLSNYKISQFNEVLNKLEIEFDLIAIECDYFNEEWNKRCLRQADEIVVFTEPHNKSNLVSFFNFLTGNGIDTHAKKRIVIAQENHIEHPVGTKALLAGIKFESHHHIKKEDEKSLNRLARHISGDTTGFVLSGGGAKGFAHLGIIKALMEHDYEFDMVGGTSMGALFSTLVAMEYPIKIIYDKARKAFPKNITSDYAMPPIISLVKGNRVKRAMNYSYPNIDIEDTWIPFYCVSSNLSSSQLHVHTSGNLRMALHASIALPGILPPVVLNNELHIDGGVFDNLPIEFMYKVGINFIIASEINRTNSQALNFDILPSNKELFFDKFSKEKKYSVPNLFSIISESVVLGSNQKLQHWKQFANMLISPDLCKYGLTEWDKFDQLTEEGYAFANKLLST